MRRFLLLLAAVPLMISVSHAGETGGQLHVGVTIGAAAPDAAAAAAPRYTWGAAAISVTKAGFDSPLRLAAHGDVYWFSAEKDGVTYRVAVSAATGSVVAVEPA